MGRPADRLGPVALGIPPARAGLIGPAFVAVLLSVGLAGAAPSKAAPAPAADEAPAVRQVGRYRLQSNAWVNLHQRLMSEARFDTPAPARLAGDDRGAWKQAVTAYAAWLGQRHPIFDKELIAVNDALSATWGDALPASIPPRAAEVLKTAMPLYRASQWDADDRANRFWMAIAAPLLESAAEELAAAHARAYGVPFPTHILVDMSPQAWEFGAYTVGEGDTAHTVMTSTEAGYQGFGALEMLLHEPSHAIVGSDSGAIGAELARAAKETGLRPYAYLWHAILFYTSGELTRRALLERGVSEFHPSILGMYEHGGYGDLRKALETHWQDCLDGKVERYDAIRQILIETAPRHAGTK